MHVSPAPRRQPVHRDGRLNETLILFNASVKANLEEGKRLLEDTTLEEYDREIRETYTPKWIESAQKATRVLDEL
ncbi:MAG: hypothetical protein R6U10_04565 [Thermoplasmatota archaeon]